MALYAMAALVGGLGCVQIVKMMNWHDLIIGKYLHLIYLSALMLCVIECYVLMWKKSHLLNMININVCIFLILLTMIPVFYSLHNGESPSSYEYYIGEISTIIIGLLSIFISVFKNMKILAQQGDAPEPASLAR